MGSPTCEKLKQFDAVGDAIAESDMWDAAKPEEVKGLVHWLLAGEKTRSHLVAFVKPDTFSNEWMSMHQ